MLEAGDVVMVTGPFDPNEADESIRKYEGAVGIVTRVHGYIRVHVPTMMDCTGAWVQDVPFLPEEVRRVKVEA